MAGGAALRQPPGVAGPALTRGQPQPPERRPDGVREGAWTISRFKGLGEMSAEQLWETTLNPDTRRLLPVQLGDLDFARTEALMTQLMGKGEAAARRELMELHGDSIEIDV